VKLGFFAPITRIIFIVTPYLLVVTVSPRKDKIIKISLFLKEEEIWYKWENSTLP